MYNIFEKILIAWSKGNRSTMAPLDFDALPQALSNILIFSTQPLDQTRGMG